jgi:photosystem II stability/assembly factor-like uncharacterized protein
MRFILIFIASLILIYSCSRSNDSVLPPIKQDTLLSGWTKYQLDATSNIFDVAFSTLAKGYISVFNKGMYQSSDSGKTWNFIPATSGKNIYTIRFLNSQYGYCIGDEINNSFGFTSDGGKNWNFKNSPDGGGWDIQFLSSSVGYVAGEKGLFKTINMGDTWTLLKSGKYSGIHFIDEQNGWATSYDSPARIYSTNDGGITWNIKYDNGPDGFYTIQFINANTGWATSSSKITKTTDGGITWQSQNNAVDGFDIEFLNPDLGYRTQGEKIFKSIDGGQNWTTEVTVIETPLTELVFLDPDHGWAIGNKGTILRYQK